MSSNRYEQQKLEAISACRAGRFEEAECLLRDLLHVLQRYGGEIESSQVRYWYLVARYRGDADQAMKTFMGPVAADELTERPSEHVPKAAEDLPRRGDEAIRDELFDRAIGLLTKDMVFPTQECFQARLAPSESACAEALSLLEQLREAHPHDASAHAAYAFALEIAGKAMSASSQLAECSRRFPGRWELSLTQQREWLWVMNPLKLPPFDPQQTAIHPAINASLLSSIIYLTRDGPWPRAVLFLKGSADDFNVWALKQARMQFTTLISTVNRPQIVAVMGRIHDDPSNPYDIEDVEAPFRPHAHHRRITFETFVRQQSFPLVIVDPTGRVLHTRDIEVSGLMAAAHQTLQQRFDAEPGEEMAWDDIAAAIRRHQMLVDPKHVQY